LTQNKQQHQQQHPPRSWTLLNIAHHPPNDIVRTAAGTGPVSIVDVHRARDGEALHGGRAIGVKRGGGGEGRGLEGEGEKVILNVRKSGLMVIMS
jgi:hypothetical protein